MMTNNPYSYIDFNDVNTDAISEGLKIRLLEENNQFNVLNLGKGTGKTAIGVATAGKIARHFNKTFDVFVVAPIKKIQDGSWSSVISLYMERYPGRIRPAGEWSPDSLVNMKKADKMLKRDWKKAGMPIKLSEIIEQFDNNPTILIVDEVQMFKKPTSSRSKALQKLAKHAIGIGLSATPMTNGAVEDGIGYLILNGFYKNKSQFYKEHIPDSSLDKFYLPNVLDKYGEIDPNLFNGLEKFEDEIAKTIYTPNLINEIKLPDVVRKDVEYKLSSEGRKEIEYKAKKYRKRYYDNYVTYLADVTHTIANDKNHMKELKRIMNEYEPTCPLIFYQKNVDLEAICQSLEEINMHYFIINGKHGLSEIEPDKYENYAVIIQYKAGSRGIEFKNSNMSIFYELTYSWQDIDQAMGRNIRRNGEGVVHQFMMVSDAAWDQHVYEAINNKRKFTRKLQEKLAEDITDDVIGAS